MHDTFAVQAWYEAAQTYMPATVASDTDSATADTSCDSQAPSDSDTSPLILFFCLCRSVQGLFFLSLFVSER
jgi:hypothetical protein